ncbi:type IV secretory system conjugative DNA transfer family protein [Paracoccus denitrificans]|uniref:type IV secretory system conjugative DNA transfer family protein n=1 Tax=Paracoccus denitrificans TaxID=266 RepID=UPI001E4FB0EF|nr:type IV secretory system conjugative DNA transfer family protein [Paracoccus denitrificans]UFS67289.1 type IV secretory system conjugative DNA transfer family protein [Paracoccus denitrificans]
MSGTKILWGQISVVFLIVLIFVWSGTQWTAWRFGFQPQLGPPWFEVWGIPVYYPPALFWWWYFYDAYAPRIFVEGGIIAASGGFLAIGIAILMSVYRAREAADVDTYGSARWAGRAEIERAGLLGLDGVVLGRYDQGYLRHDGPEHVLCFAPTRSGKGVGLVVPTLLTWPGSAIVHDIKGENWQLTAGFRARHGRVLLFDPTNAASAAYNPLLEVRRGEWEVRDVQNIADILVDPEGSLEKRNHWEKTSHALLVGVILHVLYAEEDKTLARVAAFLSDPRRSATQRRAVPAAPVIPAAAARNHRYGLQVQGASPPWRPVSVFDDGRRTYVVFPRGIAQGEMPPIFVLGPEGEPEIVNSRVHGNVLIVDRLFGVAELRLGSGKRQQVVRIHRLPPAKGRSPS